MGDDDHAEHADQLARELGDMERQTERVTAEIDEAREDWERKKRDPSVPGAGKPGDAGPEGEPEGP